MSINFSIDGIILKPSNNTWFVPEDDPRKGDDFEATVSRAHHSENYMDFSKVLKTIQIRTTNNTEFVLFIRNHTLYTFRIAKKNDRFDRAQLFDVYGFESPTVEAIFKHLFGVGRLSWSHGVRFIVREPHKVLGVNECVFRLVVACRLLDRAGTEVYHNFEKVFPNGKVRVLSEPDDTIKETLKDMNDILYSAYGEQNRGVQCAYKKNLSIIDNALPHQNNRYLFKGDISNFFPSCKRELVKKYTAFMFENCVNANRLHEYFLDKMLIDDGLCLGNPISATIANAIVAGPARYINNICKKHGIAFTQYSDDITFSSNRPISKDWVCKVFATAYEQYGLLGYFTLKPEKLYSLVGQQRNVTGVAFDAQHENALTPRQRITRSMRVGIHKYSLGEPVNISKIRGQVAFSVMIGKGARTLRYLNKFGDGVKRTFMSEDLERRILEAI